MVSQTGIGGLSERRPSERVVEGRTRRYGRDLQGLRTGLRPLVDGVGEAAAEQDTFFRRRRVLVGSQLRSSHMEFAQPDRRVRRIKSHEPIVQQLYGKDKDRRCLRSRVTQDQVFFRCKERVGRLMDDERWMWAQ